MSKVAICVGESTLLDPSSIGLAGEDLKGQKWLDVYIGAREAREGIRANDEIAEVWVVDNDEMDPINLAAAIKGDRREVRVCMFAKDAPGSFLSRAYAASLDAVYDELMFTRRYSAAKAALSTMANRSFSSSDSSSKDSIPSAGFASEGFAFTSEGRLSNSEKPADSGEVSLSEAQNRGPLLVSMDGASVEGVSVDSGSAVSELAAAGLRAEMLAVGEPYAKSNFSSTLPALTKRSSFAFLLTVISGSGGSGKSTIAALAALCTQAHGLRTVLLDFDLQFGNASEFFNGAESVPVDNLLADPTLVVRAAAHGSVPFVITPPEKPEKSELIAKRTAYLVDLLSESFDVIVANTGAYWTEQHAVLLERTSKALFLVDQRTSSLKACQRALFLCERCGIPTGSFLFAVNRCSKNSLFSSIDVSCALKGAETVEFKDGGKDVEEFSSSGLMVDLAVVDNPLYSSIENVLSSFVPGFVTEVGSEAAKSRRPWIPKKRGFIRKKDER